MQPVRDRTGQDGGEATAGLCDRGRRRRQGVGRRASRRRRARPCRWSAARPSRSNDAPVQRALSVVYTAAGEFESYQLVRRNPALVVVGHFGGGRGAAETSRGRDGRPRLATWFEARNMRRGPRAQHARPARPRGPRPRSQSFAIARLLADGTAAFGRRGRSGAVTARARTTRRSQYPVVRARIRVVPVLAAAHAVHNGLTVLPATHPFPARREGGLRRSRPTGA